MGRMRKLEAGQFLHTATLRRLDEEAALLADVYAPPSPDWYACFQDGNSVPQAMTNFKTTASNAQLPMPYQVEFAHDLCASLNKHVAHNGTWIVAWTHPPSLFVMAAQPNYDWRRFIMLHLDADGDAQFTIDNIQDMAEITMAAPEHWIEEAELAWKHWHHLMREVLDPSPDQLVKRAANS